MNQTPKLFEFDWGFQDASAVKATLYSLASVVILLVAAALLIFIITKYVIPLCYRLIYRNYLESTEENFVVLDVRIYNKSEERLVVENEDMDRFMMSESRSDLAVSGDVLVGYKEVNTKTGKINYLYNKRRVFYKTQKGG